MKFVAFVMAACLSVVVCSAVLGVNMLRNASFEAGAVHWFLHGTSTTGETLSVVDNPVKFGTRAVMIQKPDSLGEVQLVSDYVIITNGTQVTLSAWLRSDTVGQNVTLRLWGWDPVTIGLRRQLDQTVSVGTWWQRFSFTWTAPGAISNMYRVNLVLKSAGNLWADGVQLEQGGMTAFAPKESIGLGLTPNNLTNVYYADENVAPTIRVVNHTGQTRNLTARFGITDFAGQPVSSFDLPVTVPPNDVYETSVAISPAKLGYFRVGVTLLDGQTTSDSLEWAYGRVTRMQGVNEKRFGLCMEMENVGFETPRSVILGAGSVRLHNTLLWANVEPVPGFFDWRYGQFVAPLADAGLAPMVYLHGIAGWATNYALTPPWLSDVSLWNNYVGQVVGHYKDRMKDWEIWNEPYANVPTVEQYIAMLQGAYPAAKAADPDCTVIGLCGGITDVWDDYNRQVFREALTSMDVVSFHPYMVETPEQLLGERIDAQRTIMSEFGSKPIWLTEFGGGASDWPYEPDVGGAWEWFDEAGQAQCLVSSFVISFAHQVERYYWFFQSSHVYGGGYTSSIFAPDSLSSVKKAAPAYAVMTRALHGLGFDSRMNVPDTSVHLYRFSGPGRQTIVAWKAQGSTDLTLWVRDGALSAIDIMGNPVPLQVNGEQVTVPLSKYQLFLNGNTSTRISIQPFQDLPGALTPIGMNNKAVGGGDLGAPPLGQSGVTGGSGLNNVGLLVRVWGRVTEAGSDYVLINDGSGVVVRIDTSRLTSPPARDEYVGVTGISSLYKDGEVRTRFILPRDESDVRRF